MVFLNTCLRIPPLRLACRARRFPTQLCAKRGHCWPYIVDRMVHGLVSGRSWFCKTRNKIPPLGPVRSEVTPQSLYQTHRSPDRAQATQNPRNSLREERTPRSSRASGLAVGEFIRLAGSLVLVACMVSGVAIAHTTKGSSARMAQRAALYRSLPQATGITEGHGPRVLYDFFDPNCPYCHMLYKRLQPLIGPYHLTVHAIPVAYLTSTSPGKAAALLQARDRLAALHQSQAHYSWKQGSSIAPVIPTPATRRALAVNLKLDTEAAGFPLVPILVYQKADGTIRVINSGAPPVWALKQIVASIKR